MCYALVQYDYSKNKRTVKFAMDEKPTFDSMCRMLYFSGYDRRFNLEDFHHLWNGKSFKQNVDNNIEYCIIQF